MSWIKQGCIFSLKPSEHRTTHVQVPTPYVMEDRIRIYYAGRDTKNKSFSAFFDLSKDLKTIIQIHEYPIMKMGRPGMFDADGVMPSCVFPKIDQLWMYNIGWNALQGSGARYQNEIGLAISDDDGETFNQMFDGPIIGRSTEEPGLAVMPFVMYKNFYRCWYQSGTGWHKVGDQYEPTYVIKYAESLDGIKWNRFPETCVEPKDSFEAFSRPSVVFQKGIYRMWYCYRGSVDYRGGEGSYRIGYAESPDGIYFTRMDDQSGIGLGPKDEFDSDMQSYPYVIEVDGRLLMFYNGNNFGQTGVGLAIWN